MTTPDSRTIDVARSLWALAEGPAVPAGDVQAITDELFRHVEAGLRRWIGAEGYAVLLSRSIAETLPAHPALSSISDLGADSRPQTSTDEPLADEAARRDAVIALLATMMKELGHIIGEDMAIRLIELSGTPTPRGLSEPVANDLS